MNLNDVEYIIVHCSASDLLKDDSIGAIKALHMGSSEASFNWGRYKTKGKDFSDVGYHYFIDSLGRCFDGRSLNTQGAHCSGYNDKSIGICLSGEKYFYPEQFKTLKRVLINLQEVLPSLKRIVGHNYFNQKKTCPNFSLNYFLKKNDLL